MELRIPKLRPGSVFPSLLERRRRIDQALFAGVMEAYLHAGGDLFPSQADRCAAAMNARRRSADLG